MNTSLSDIKEETNRLYEKLNKLGWAREDCEYISPYMKEIQLIDVLKALKNPMPDQFIIAKRAQASLSRMFELEKIGKDILNKKA